MRISTVQDVIEVLRENGIELYVEGNNLHYRAPAGTVLPELEEILLEHKDEILPVITKRILAGHEVSSVLWETPKMVIFEDLEGKTWRYLYAWGKAWEMEIGRA